MQRDASDSRQGVEAELRIRAGNQDPGAPIDAKLSSSRALGHVEITIKLNERTEWVLELEAAEAAYFAGGLAYDAGVR